MTHLMHACSCGGKKGSLVAEELIQAGANVSYVRKSDDMTALKFAVGSTTPQVIQALIDHGAEVDGPSGTSQTALMLAARKDDVVGKVGADAVDVDREVFCAERKRFPTVFGCTVCS